MKKYLIFSFLIALLMVVSSCGTNEKILRGDDVALKVKIADQYYERGRYERALPYYDQLLSVYRGTAQAETIYYRYATCSYKMNEFLSAGYHFKQFAETYPLSDKAEEAYFLSAECMYRQSPQINLDQSSTQKAIDGFQLFINKYPASPKIEECNKKIDDLNLKIERKSYDNAMLYYQVEDYKSAVWALKRFVGDYPSSKYREVAEFTAVKAAVSLADNSIESKKKERFKDAQELLSDFMEKKPSQEFKAETEKLNRTIHQNL